MRNEWRIFILGSLFDRAAQRLRARCCTSGFELENIIMSVLFQANWTWPASCQSPLRRIPLDSVASSIKCTLIVFSPRITGGSPAVVAITIFAARFIMHSHRKNKLKTMREKKKKRSKIKFRVGQLDSSSRRGSSGALATTTLERLNKCRQIAL